MCGLVGYYSSECNASHGELVAMGNAIAHRGPDDSGVWISSDESVGIAHQRLAVVDLSQAGAQPMSSTNGRYIVAYNGEIYNHLALRKEHLQSISWTGTSDTETLVQLIERYGVMKAPSLLVGMFAIVVWDKHTQTLHLIRDRFGEKPLYYGFQGDRFYFSSELSALNSSDEFKPTISQTALSLYFQFLYVPNPYSIYEDIYKAPSGHIISLDTNTMTLKESEYWSVAAMESSRPTIQPQYATEQLETLLIDAISDQLAADVPVGAFLSGGVDSSSVVAIMSELKTGPVSTYSIGFNSAQLNEAHHAKDVANHLQTNHHEWYISDAEVTTLVADIATCFDEPFADSSQIATSAVSQLAAQDVTVCITGDGGDELFGGYTRYKRGQKIAASRNKLGVLGRSLSKGIVNLGISRPNVNGIHQLASNSRIGRAIQLLSKDSELDCFEDMCSYWRYPYSPAKHKGNRVYKRFEQIHEKLGSNNSRLQQFIDLSLYMQDDILVKVDRTAMQHSLETRVPMLDHRFAAYAWSLPCNVKSPDVSNKSLLLDIASSRLPRHLLERPKKGFSVPLASWLNGPLRPLVEESFESTRLAKHDLLNQNVLSMLYKQFYDGKKELAPLVWSVVCFQQWYKSTFT